MGVDTIKRQTRAAYGCLVADQSPWARALQPIGCTLALSVTQKRCCSCSMWLEALYKCYMPLSMAVHCKFCIRLRLVEYFDMNKL